MPHSAVSDLGLYATSLSKYIAVCTALVCGVQCSMPARLGHWQSQTSSVCSLNDRPMIRQICNCHHQVQWATCAAWHRGSGPHSGGEKTPMVWTCGMLQWCSQDSLWHTGWWKVSAWEAQDDIEKLTERYCRDCREWKLSAINPHDRHTWRLVWDLCEICHVCSKPAIWKGAHWCGCCWLWYDYDIYDCLPMSLLWDARLNWVKQTANECFLIFRSNWAWYFLWIISSLEAMHRICRSLFWQKSGQYFSSNKV